MYLFGTSSFQSENFQPTVPFKISGVLALSSRNPWQAGTSLRGESLSIYVCFPFIYDVSFQLWVGCHSVCASFLLNPNPIDGLKKKKSNFCARTYSSKLHVSGKPLGVLHGKVYFRTPGIDHGPNIIIYNPNHLQWISPPPLMYSWILVR